MTVTVIWIPCRRHREIRGPIKTGLSAAVIKWPAFRSARLIAQWGKVSTPQQQQICAPLMFITCSGIHLKVAAEGFGHVVGQRPLGGGVGINGRHLHHRSDLLHVFQHWGKVDWLWEFWWVVIDVQHLHHNMSPGGQWFSTEVGGIDQEPVEGYSLTVQNLCCADYTWRHISQESGLEVIKSRPGLGTEVNKSGSGSREPNSGSGLQAIKSGSKTIKYQHLLVMCEEQETGSHTFGCLWVFSYQHDCWLSD